MKTSRLGMEVGAFWAGFQDFRVEEFLAQGDYVYRVLGCRLKALRFMILNRSRP